MKNSTFSHNLKLLRKTYSLSQEELGLKINVSKQTISKYEKGLIEPNFHTLVEISKVFNCTLDYLAFGNLKQETKNPISLNLILEEKLNTLKIELSNTIEDILKNEISNTINRFFKNEISDTIDKFFKNEIPNTSDKFKYLVEFSEELTPLNIINFNKYKDNNSLDLNFYKNNNLKICNSSYSKFTHSNQEQLSDIPFYRNISCGALKYTDGSIEDYFYLHKNDLKYDKSDYFILQIDGESMNKLYKNGDYILIHKNKNYEGYKPYVFILGDEATLKYIDIDLENRNIILVPHSTDSSYQKQILKFEDLNSTNFGILGTIEGVLNFLD